MTFLFTEYIRASSVTSAEKTAMPRGKYKPLQAMNGFYLTIILNRQAQEPLEVVV